jgi:hypothetical protein
MKESSDVAAKECGVGVVENVDFSGINARGETA